jgi:hypothetical protein
MSGSPGNFQFAEASGLGTCTACPAGYEQLNLGRTTCEGCSFGQFSVEGDPAGCQDCAPGTFTIQQRQAQCSNCGNGQYQPAQGQVSCIQCDAGSFATNVEPSSACTLCSVGKFQPLPDPNQVLGGLNVGQTSCDECALGSQTEDSAGAFVREGAVSCDPCDAGSSLGLNVDQQDPAFAGCVACAPGQSQASTGQVSCDACNAGEYQPTAGEESCIPCTAGSQTEDASQAFVNSGAVACQQCDRGRSADVDQHGNPDPTLACAECDVGRYQDQRGQTQCEGCAAGQVVNTVGSDGPGDCVPCGTGEYQPQAGQAVCLSDCTAGFNTVAIGTCEHIAVADAAACAAVTGIDLYDSTACDLVGPGSCAYTYGAFTNTGAVDCAGCLPGRFSVDATGAVACTDCDPGQAQADPGQVSCDPCSSGRYQPASGQPTCDACVPGSQTEDGSGNPGASTASAFVASGAIACEVCGVGFTGSNPDVACLICEPGHYQDEIGQPQCKTCDPGKYTPAEGSVSVSACIDCAFNDYQPTAGSASCLTCSVGSQPEGGAGQWVNTGAVACDACEPGQYGDTLPGGPGSPGGDMIFTCVACDVGQFQDTEQQTSCDPCVAGDYQPSVGQSDCVACPPGSQTEDDTGAFTDSGAVACDSCEPGRSADTDAHGNPDATLECSLCAAGQYQNQAGRTSCKECTAGRFVETQGSTAAMNCIACPAGTYSHLTARTLSSDCIPCVGGKYVATTASNEATDCIDCPSGRFVLAAGSDELADCSACTAGTYQPGTGHTTCIECDPGHQTEDSTGAFVDTAATLCTSCVSGRYNTPEIPSGHSYPSQLECAECAPGSMTADVSDPAVAVFQLHGATGCASCYAPIEACTAIDTSNAAHVTFCGAATLDGQASACTDKCVAADPDCSTPDLCTGGTYDGDANAGTPDLDCATAWDGATGASCTDQRTGTFTQAAVGGGCSGGSEICTASDAPCNGATSESDCETLCAADSTCTSYEWLASSITSPETCVDTATNCAELWDGSTQGSCRPGCTFVESPPSCTDTIADCSGYIPGDAANPGTCPSGCTLTQQIVAPAECTLSTSYVCNPGGGDTNGQTWLRDLAGCAYQPEQTALGATICAYSPNAEDLIAQNQDCANGACGFADLDSDSATACASCPVGTFVDSDSQLECTDFDECASSPCENGGLCSNPVLEHPAYLGNPIFVCDCSASGFIGERCSFLDECAHDPCYLTVTTPPAELDIWPSTARTPSPSPVFLCPTRMECTDPDMTVTDDYICTCPTCDATVFTANTASLITDHFASHPGYAKHLVGMISRLNDAHSVCAEPARTGCTNPDSYNFNSMAAVDDGSCVPKVYGCTDPQAVNFDPAANQYDNTGVLGQRCRAAVCAPPVCAAWAACSMETTDDTGVSQGCFEATSPYAGDFSECTACAPAVTSASTVCEACEAAFATVLASCGRTDVAPSCPDGWAGPRGGECVRHVHADQQTRPWSCEGNSIIVEFGDCPSCIQVDECAVVGGVAPDPVGPCNDPSHRLCVEATGLGGYVGPDCTNTRQAFMCGENTGTPSGQADYDFACVDPNPYWMGDFTCGCAFDYVATNPSYEPSIATNCGTDTVFTDASTGTPVSNYELTFYLESREAARNHLCEQLHDPAPDCMKVTGMCSGNTGHEWRWSSEQDVVCDDGFQLQADSHTIPRGAGHDFATAAAKAACCEESLCTASFPMPASSGYGVGRQHGVEYSSCVDGDKTGDTCIPVCAIGFFDGGTTATGFELLCLETGEYPMMALDASLVCTACNDMASVASVASCQVCSDATAASCSDGTCADGYHTYQSGLPPSCVGTCTTVSHAEVGATYTCTDATDSRVSGCADGFFLTVGGPGELDTCTACDGVLHAVAVTCAEPGNSRATACVGGYALEDNSGAAASDVCHLDAGGR